MSEKEEIRWENLFNQLEKKEFPLNNNEELKILLRLGVPSQYRGKIWKIVIDYRLSRYKERYSSNYYENLLTANMAITDPAFKQVSDQFLSYFNKHIHKILIYTGSFHTLNSAVIFCSPHFLLMTVLLEI